MASPQVRALIGARVSSFQGDEKTSNITQRDKGEAYATSQDWHVVGAFEDLDVSAIKLSPWQRPDLRVWLEERPDDFDALIFAKTDRVFRSAADCIDLARWCEKTHKILVLVDDGIKLDYYNPEDEKDAFAGAMAKVFLILASVFAEIEGRRFVQRARDRVAFLRNTDRWGYGIPPFGYMIVDHPSGKGKSLELEPETQKVLHKMAAWLLSGWSLTRIVDELNASGVFSPMDWIRHRKGQPVKEERWTTSTVGRILGRLSTQGIKLAKGKPVLTPEGEYVRVGPPSFEDEVWDMIQAALEKLSVEPRARKQTTNRLLGITKCLHCGNNAYHHAPEKKSTGVVYRYYKCAKSNRECPRGSVRAEVAEKLVETGFLALHRDRRIRERIWQSGSDHSAELEQTLRTIESLREDRALGLFTTSEDEDMFRGQMKALITKRDALSAMPITRAGWVDMVTERTYADVWPTASDEERRKMLVDAGIELRIGSPTDLHLILDPESVLGDGPTGEALKVAFDSIRVDLDLSV